MQGQALQFFLNGMGAGGAHYKMERAMGIENRDKGENRPGVEEILYRSVGGVCAVMALWSP
jgi:hypothetical protein